MSLSLWEVHFEPDQAALIPLPVEADCSTLDALSARLPGGAYTTFRTFEGRKALLLNDHLERLGQTASLAGKPVALDTARLRSALRQVVQHTSAGQNLRLRLTLDLEVAPGTVYISAEALHTPPPEAYCQGVQATTVTMQRQLPKAKLTRFIARSGPVRQSLPPEVNEAIMADEQGCLLEGLSSNFFAWQAGELWTAEEGVLSGITRSLALECAAALRLPVRLQPARREQIPTFEEAFITSSSRAVLPLRQIDETIVGAAQRPDGAPGPLTRRLMAAYQSRLDALIEPI